MIADFVTCLFHRMMHVPDSLQVPEKMLPDVTLCPLAAHSGQPGQVQRPGRRRALRRSAASSPSPHYPRPASAPSGVHAARSSDTFASATQGRRPNTGGAQSKRCGAALSAWVPKDASVTVQQFLADWVALYGGANRLWEGCHGAATVPEETELALTRMQAADALVVMLDRLFLQREDARVGAVKARHRQRLKDVTRRLEHQRSLTECVESQRAAWAKQQQKQRPNGTAAGCQGVLAASMGKSFAAARCASAPVHLSSGSLRCMRLMNLFLLACRLAPGGCSCGWFE